MLDHLDAPSEMFLDPFFTSACVALINPQMLKARELACKHAPLLAAASQGVEDGV